MAEVTQVLNQPLAVWGTLQVPFVSVAQRLKRHEAAPASHTRLVAVIDGKVIGTAGLHPADHPRRSHVASIGLSGSTTTTPGSMAPDAPC